MGDNAHTKPYEVHTALRDDLNEGWVWVRDSGLKDQLQDQRRIVRIEFNGKKVYCEALYADKYYLKRFGERRVKDDLTEIPSDKDLVFINGWYRQRLGIPRNSCSEHDLQIEIAKFLVLSQFCACLQHPQSVVFLATVLAILGLGLGIIGVGLGLIGIKDLWCTGQGVGIAFVIAGAIICAVGFIPFFRRATQQ